MGRSDGSNDSADHSLTARRNPGLMREGLELQARPIEMEKGRRVLPVILTNLAGHDYPTGTRRRALELWVETDEENVQPRLVEVLTPMRIPELDPSLRPALAPGEQRMINLPVPPGASSITCRMIYRRDRFDPQSLSLDVGSVTMRLQGP